MPTGKGGSRRSGRQAELKSKHQAELEEERARRELELKRKAEFEAAALAQRELEEAEEKPTRETKRRRKETSSRGQVPLSKKWSSNEAGKGSWVSLTGILEKDSPRKTPEPSKSKGKRKAAAKPNSAPASSSTASETGKNPLLEVASSLHLTKGNGSWPSSQIGYSSVNRHPMQERVPAGAAPRADSAPPTAAAAASSGSLRAVKFLMDKIAEINVRLQGAEGALRQQGSELNQAKYTISRMSQKNSELEKHLAKAQEEIAKMERGNTKADPKASRASLEVTKLGKRVADTENKSLEALQVAGQALKFAGQAHQMAAASFNAQYWQRQYHPQQAAASAQPQQADASAASPYHQQHQAQGAAARWVQVPEASASGQSQYPPQTDASADSPYQPQQATPVRWGQAPESAASAASPRHQQRQPQAGAAPTSRLPKSALLPMPVEIESSESRNDGQAPSVQPATKESHPDRLVEKEKPNANSR